VFRLIGTSAAAPQLARHIADPPIPPATNVTMDAGKLPNGAAAISNRRKVRHLLQTKRRSWNRRFQLPSEVSHRTSFNSTQSGQLDRAVSCSGRVANILHGFQNGVRMEDAL
jgi:hypothetical protein